MYIYIYIYIHTYIYIYIYIYICEKGLCMPGAFLLEKAAYIMSKSVDIYITLGRKCKNLRDLYKMYRIVYKYIKTFDNYINNYIKPKNLSPASDRPTGF